MQQREQIANARKRAAHDLRIADNTYETVEASFQLRNLMRDPAVGKLVVPIVPDEARTFGMDPLFKQAGIYAPFGQRYEPVDSELLLSYRESQNGQVLEEGISEAGSMASFQASGTAYATHAVGTIPFYVFYSMFGFQRVGDQIWQSGDARVRGFLIGATAGRTTLAGEGLQHQDGHSQLLMSTIPNCVSYDPAYAYELATIVQDGLRRMYVDQESIYYYLTVMNENYAQPAMPPGVEGLIYRHQKEPVRLALSSDTMLVAEVHHAYYVTASMDKPANLARVILHEMDHLDGILILDRVRSLSLDVFPRVRRSKKRGGKKGTSATG